MFDEMVKEDFELPWYKTPVLPCLITALRLVMLPFIIALHAMGHLTGAFVLFIPAALSDTVDGWVARRFKLDSKFGHKFDQTADKIFNLTIFFYFFVWHHITGGQPAMKTVYTPWVLSYPILYLLLAFVEFINSASRWHWLEVVRRYFSEKTSWVGKAKTWIMGISAGCLFYGTDRTYYWGQLLFHVAILMAMGSVIRRFRFVRDGR